MTDRQTDGQTDRHRMTAIAALMHSIARQKLNICLFVLTEFKNVTDRHADKQTPHDGTGRAWVTVQIWGTGFHGNFNSGHLEVKRSKVIGG